MEGIIKWINFLAMLGSEKSLAYWNRLEIPVDRSGYDDTLRFARGCLELYVQKRLRNDNEHSNSNKLWQQYRRSGGTLTDDVLQQEAVDIADEASVRDSFYKVAKICDYDNAKGLYRWFSSVFRIYPDPLIQTAEMFTSLIDLATGKSLKFEMTADTLSKLDTFCRRIRLQNKNIRSHFYIAGNVFSTVLATEWDELIERVLDGSWNGTYSWLDSVENTYESVKFLRRWEELKGGVGPEQSSLLLSWLEQNRKTFPDIVEITDADVARLLRFSDTAPGSG